jgi:hypothetical protein
MPVDGNPAGIAHERQDQQTGQRQLLLIPEVGEPDYHIRVSHCRLVFICSEKPVPPKED